MFVDIFFCFLQLSSFTTANICKCVYECCVRVKVCFLNVNGRHLVLLFCASLLIIITNDQYGMIFVCRIYVMFVLCITFSTMFDNWYSCWFTLVLLSKMIDQAAPKGGFVCFSALLSCSRTKNDIFFLDYVFVYQFSVSRISSVRVKLKFDFSFKSVLRCKRRIVCFGMNFKSIIWFLVKLCLSAREYTVNAKTEVFVKYLSDSRSSCEQYFNTWLNVLNCSLITLIES